MSVKLKSILTAAMFLATLTGSSLPTVPASASSVDAIRDGNLIAEANGIVLDSDADAAELAVLRNLNGGVLPQIDFENAGSVSHIDGLISNQTVRSEADAMDVIKSVANLLGIRDAETELSFLRKENEEFYTIYTFYQVHQGVRVADSFVVVFVNTETGKADYLNSSFATDCNVETEPAISATEAEMIVERNYNTELLENAELVIVREKNDDLKLAYIVAADSLDVGVIYIDAMKGSVMYGPAMNDYYTYTYKGGSNGTTAHPITGKVVFSINIYSTSSDYYLYDSARNIYMLYCSPLNKDKFDRIIQRKINNSLGDEMDTRNLDPTNAKLQKILNPFEIKDMFPYIFTESKLEDFTYYYYDNTAIGVQYQVARAYDFYKGAFAWKGTDNNNGNLMVYALLAEERSGNASSYPYLNLISFGPSDSVYNHAASELAIVIHEYTHRVMQNKLLWNLVNKRYGEAPCVKEAYADILGEYGESFCNNKLDWKLGNQMQKNKWAMRDLTNPYNVTYYTDNDAAGYYNKHYYKVSGSTANMEEHEGSTIISHAAYRMHKYGIPQDKARKIWYNSIANLKGTSYSFKNCRTAVTNSATNVLTASYSDLVTARKKIMSVHSAFNYAKVYPKTSFKMGDINNDGKVTTADVTVVSRFASDSSFWRTSGYTVEQISKGDVNYDGVITKADAEMITKALSNGTTSKL